MTLSSARRPSFSDLGKRAFLDQSIPSRYQRGFGISSARRRHTPALDWDHRHEISTELAATITREM
jgi:hypothetical protein